MTTKFDFYAIVDDEHAIVSVTHQKYGEMKAVFSDEKLAFKALEMQKCQRGLRVEKCEISKPTRRKK